MKTDIHPDVHPVIFVDTSSGVEFVTTSTMKSEETRDVDGVTHYILPIEISSASHPFFTGEQILVDTSRRVEKFQARAQKQAEEAEKRKGKKAKREERLAAQQAEEEAAKPAKEKKAEPAPEEPAPAESTQEQANQ